MLSKAHCRKSIAMLRALESRLQTAHMRLAIPFIFRGKGHFKSMRCMQNPWEIEQLFNIVCAMQPKHLLEIGTAKGGALYLWAQAAAPDAALISVDLPLGNYGGGYPACRIPFYQSFVRHKQKMHLVRADSHSEKTVQEVLNLLQGSKLDFLFIDGDHTYEGVKRDFALYSPLVKPGGLIGFHDILPRKDVLGIEVDRFWNEIRTRYPSEELIHQGTADRAIGCGLIRLPI